MRPALAVQRPDLCLVEEPPRPARLGPGPFLGRRRPRRHRDGGLAVRRDDGCAAQGFAHRRERVPSGAEHVIPRCSEVLHEGNAVGHLHGLWGARAGAVDLRFQAISGDDGDIGMLTSPGGECVGLAVVEQCHWPPRCYVHDDRPLALALPVGPVIAPTGRERWDGW